MEIVGQASPTFLSFLSLCQLLQAQAQAPVKGTTTDRSPLLFLQSTAVKSRAPLALNLIPLFQIPFSFQSNTTRRQLRKASVWLDIRAAGSAMCKHQQWLASEALPCSAACPQGWQCVACLFAIAHSMHKNPSSSPKAASRALFLDICEPASLSHKTERCNKSCPKGFSSLYQHCCVCVGGAH